jgi:hypothetical protein
MTTHNGTATLAPISSASDLSAALLAAEKGGQFPAEAWPAMRDLLLSSSDPTLATVLGPLHQLVTTRQAVFQARQALDSGFAALGRAADDPAAITEAAANLAALADDLAARAQQLGELINL